MRTISIRGFLFCITLFCSFFSTFAGWEQCNGPSGLKVKVLASHGETVFAGTDESLFQSNDGGETWKMPDGITWYPSVEITAIALKGDTVLVSIGYQLFLSNDNGESWADISTGIIGNRIQCLIFHNQTIFVGTEAGGIYKSSNSGSSWSEVNTGLTYKNVQCFAISGNNLLAGTKDGGVFISSDNGNSWTTLGSGANGLYNTNIHALAVVGTTLFAGTYGAGVFKSTDNGVSWDMVPTGAGVIDALFTVNNNLYIGGRDLLLVSYDTLRTTTAYLTTAANRDVLSFAECEGKILVGSSDGIRILTDNNNEQILSNRGLAAPQYARFAKSGSNLFASCESRGIFISKDSGASWSNVNYGIRYSTSSVAAKDSFAIATTHMGLYRSTNHGYSWNESDSGLGYNINTTSSEVFQNIFHVGTAYGGVYRSFNNGETWSPVNNGMREDSYILSLKANDTHLFSVASNGGLYILKGTDSIWYKPTTDLSGKEITSLNASNKIVLANMKDSMLYQSSDNGNTWSPCTSGIGKKYVVSTAITDNHIFASCLDSCIYITSINNIRWTKIQNNIPISPGISLTTAEGYLIASSYRSGTYRIPLSELTGSTNTQLHKNMANSVNTQLRVSKGCNGNTTINFSLPASNRATMKIFNMCGREIVTLADKFFDAGNHQLILNTNGIANGCYVARMVVGQQTFRKSFIVSK